MSAFGSGEREDAKIETAWEALKDESTKPPPDTSDTELLAEWVVVFGRNLCGIS